MNYLKLESKYHQLIRDIRVIIDIHIFESFKCVNQELLKLELK